MSKIKEDLRSAKDKDSKGKSASNWSSKNDGKGSTVKSRSKKMALVKPMNKTSVAGYGNSESSGALSGYRLSSRRGGLPMSATAAAVKEHKNGADSSPKRHDLEPCCPALGRQRSYFGRV